MNSLFTNNLSPHRFPFHHIVPEHDDESGPDFRQHVMQAELFHKQPHADLVDSQPHDAVVDNDRNRKGDGRGVQVVDAKPFSTYVQKGVIHQEGCAADDGESQDFIELVFFHIGSP